MPSPSRPTPELVSRVLKLSGLTPIQLGDLVHCSGKTVQDWITGTAKIHPAIWELLGIKLARRLDALPPAPQATQKL